MNRPILTLDPRYKAGYDQLHHIASTPGASMVDIASCFRYYGWTCAEVEPGVWHSTFSVGTGEPYDLYVLAADGWVQLAVSPLFPNSFAGMTERLQTVLLHANQDLRLVRLALDADGDINLLADLPAAHTNAALFGQVLELLAYYANELAPQLRQLAADPDHSIPPFA